MIRNITIGLTVALFAFLLAFSNQQLAPFAIYIALLSFALGWFISYDKSKKADHVNELRNQHLAALDKLSELESANTKTIVDKQEAALKAFELLNSKILELKNSQERIQEATVAKNKELITDFRNELSSKLGEYCHTLEATMKEALDHNTNVIKQFTDRQELSNQKFDENNHSFNIAIVSFTKAISSYQDLTQTLKSDFYTIRAKFEELAEKTIVNNQKSTQAILSSIDQVNTSISTTMEATSKSINDSVAENRDAVHKITEKIVDMLKQSLDEFRKNIEAHHIETNSSLLTAYQAAVEKQNLAIKNINAPIIETVKDLNDSTRDINETTQKLDSSIRNTLNKIKQDMEENAEASSEQINDAIAELKRGIQESITSLSDELNAIAFKYTDYNEEKDIIKRLESLCNRR